MDFNYQDVNLMYTSFVNKLLEEKGLNTQPADVIDELRSDLLARLEDKIYAFILNEIQKEKLPEFENLLDNETSTEVEMNSFLNQYIPNFTEKLATVLLNFREMYIKGQ